MYVELWKCFKEIKGPEFLNKNILGGLLPNHFVVQLQDCNVSFFAQKLITEFL